MAGTFKAAIKSGIDRPASQIFVDVRPGFFSNA
jgi:hypothetical protein